MKYHLSFLIAILSSLVIAAYLGIENNLDNYIFAQNPASNKSPKLGTFDVPSATPPPTIPPDAPTRPPNFPTSPPITVPASGLITGGAVALNAPYYCIDDEDPDGCDDTTAFWVPKGVGGVSGSCGTVIAQGHKIVDSLPHFLKGIRDSLSPAINNCSYTTGTYSSGYISTYMPIDAYNLAGLKDTSKTNPTHVLGSSLLPWWQSQQASGLGYYFIPYSTQALQQHASGQQDLTGCVTFLNLSSGVHVGLFNKFEVVNSAGDGVVSILQSGVSFYVDRFAVDAWNINTTIALHQTNLQSVAGWGCHL